MVNLESVGSKNLHFDMWRYLNRQICAGALQMISFSFPA